MHFIKRIFSILFSSSAGGLYTLLFAAAIGIATFVENDFGTSAAQKLIFKSHWFELLLILFSICIVVNVIKFQLFQKKKWASLCFHLSILVILIGSGITRYFSFEGIMHIREGETTNRFVSSDTYLQIKALVNDKEYHFDEKVLFASKGDNHYQKSLLFGNELIELEVLDFVPNPSEVLVDDPSGDAYIKVVIGGEMGREEYMLKNKTSTILNGVRFNFGLEEQSDAINIMYVNDSLLFKANQTIQRMVMATQKRDTITPVQYQPLIPRALHNMGSFNFVIGEFKPKARVELKSSDIKMSSSSMAALNMKVKVNGEEKLFYISGSQGIEGNARNLSIGNVQLAVSYGAKTIDVPFSLKLNDFIMERYPGTNSASSYASEVTLIDKRENISENIRIYMNHILDHDGYRFFQSSFDKDELGTYLSVNHDAWGTRISYLGYILLTIGMIASMFSRKSRFYALRESIANLRTANKTYLVFLLVSLSILSGNSQNDKFSVSSLPPVNLEHANQFGRLIVQDPNGRMKPMNTLAKEVLRKVSRKEVLFGLSSEQIFLSMIAYPEIWNKAPIIKLGMHEKIQEVFQTKEKMISYLDFFETSGEYKLRNEVRSAFNMKPVDRGVFEKEIIKLDEKVNIVSMIFSGSLLRLFPIPDDKNNHWGAPSDAHEGHVMNETDAFPQKFVDAYVSLIKEAGISNDWKSANDLLKELDDFQKRVGHEVYPSNQKINAEILLNELNIFDRLGKLYGLLGSAFLTLLFISIFSPKVSLKWPFKIALVILVIGFIFQTTGLGLRWYVSGRAPWSNGYESMIYIAWTTILAAMIFARTTMGGLAAACILSSTVLMVAGLSWLDPEITPLVPVLKSYWLTIHVSLEAGSYGFLVLGAIIGALNLILMIFRSSENKIRMDRIIAELSYTSEMTLIGGITMLSIGTYLGGVWANESWGRYWGWDAKETWALVSILVYSFILHMRLIPGLQSKYAFNTATLFGFASVMMTYFGVNYYLSGLHSYAAGDPVPIPTFVYYTVAILILISVLAFWKNNKLEKEPV